MEILISKVYSYNGNGNELIGLIMKLDNNHQIAERLKVARITAGYKSSRSFSEQNSLPRVTYSQHESNNRKIPTESLLAYSNALGVQVSWILTGEGYPSKSMERNRKIMQYLYDHKSELNIDIPNINKDEVCTVDVTILNNILSKLISTLSLNKLNIDSEDLLDFAYKLYNNVCSTLDASSQNKMIEIAAESLVNANALSDKTQKIN